MKVFLRDLTASGALLGSSFALLTTPGMAVGSAPNDGAFYGQVVDTVTGKPIAGAKVAVRDRSGKVIAWSSTDAQGHYVIPADCLKALQLQPSRHRTLLAKIAGGIRQTAMLPGKIVVGTAKVVGGVAKETIVSGIGNTERSVVASVATGSPAPLASQVVGTTIHAVRTNVSGSSRQAAVHSALGDRENSPKTGRSELLPGEVEIQVSAKDYKEGRGKAGAYWITADGAGEVAPGAPHAWLEPVKLAPAAGDKKSEITAAAVLLSDPHVDSSMAVPGAVLKLDVKLQIPVEPKMDMRVFAREEKKHTVAELKPQANGVWSGDLQLSSEEPVGETRVTLVALHTEPVEVRLPQGKDDPLLEFARQMDTLDPSRTYDFDPRIMASENRLDLTLTVLDPKSGAPAKDANPVAPSNGNISAPAAPAPAAPAPVVPAAPAAPAAPAPAAPAAPAPAAKP